jgi:hypothetical protein
LLVVAIVRAMSPPRALPCEKIHPFYLFRYFCVETLEGDRAKQQNLFLHCLGSAGF